mgnify:CR=1 FL=1
MAVTSERLTIILFTGDVDASLEYDAADNAASPGQIDIITLASGANTITPPTGGSTPLAVTIVPPSGNTALITLKGISGDTGIVLHKTDPCTISLNSTTSTFVLTAASSIAGVRLIWS